MKMHLQKQVLFSIISVPLGTGDIPCGYDICFADDIRFAYEGNGYYTFLQQLTTIGKQTHKVLKSKNGSQSGCRYIILFQRHNRHAAFALAEGAETEGLDKLVLSQVVLNALAKCARAFTVNQRYFI